VRQAYRQKWDRPTHKSETDLQTKVRQAYRQKWDRPTDKWRGKGTSKQKNSISFLVAIWNTDSEVINI
jgi:hypothetical protein